MKTDPPPLLLLKSQDLGCVVGARDLNATHQPLLFGSWGELAFLPWSPLAGFLPRSLCREALGSSIGTLTPVDFPSQSSVTHVLYCHRFLCNFANIHPLTCPTYNMQCLFSPKHRLAAADHKTSELKIPSWEIRNGVLCFGAPLPWQLTEEK